MQIKEGVIVQGRRPKKRPAKKKRRTICRRDHSFLICNIRRKILFPSSMKIFCSKCQNNWVIIFQYSFQEAELEARREQERMEEYRRQIIEQERQRLLKEHAANLLGFLPKVGVSAVASCPHYNNICVNLREILPPCTSLVFFRMLQKYLYTPTMHIIAHVQSLHSQYFN